ncbi:MAG TPA: nuclear transport factor 2 family protein [Puia sp.]|jgi:ketosteroid isomerase-like protein
MNRFVSVVLLGLSLGARAQSKEDDIAAIRQLNAEWIHNYVTKDSTVWNRIYADDFVLVNPAGRKMTKRDILSSPFQPITAADVDFAEVQIHGNIGLIHAKCSFTVVADGKESKGSTDYLDVYEKRKGRWWAIAAHVNYLGDH